MGNCCSCPRNLQKENNTQRSPHLEQVCAEQPPCYNNDSHRQLCGNFEPSRYRTEYIPSSATNTNHKNFHGSFSSHLTAKRFRQSDLGQLGLTQHIAEREPENEDTDPSINVREEAIFVKEKKRRQLWYAELLGRMKRDERRPPNTTAEMYIDGSTVSKPDTRATIRAVAVAICLLIRSPGNNLDTAQDDLDIFDEAHHPMRIEQSPDEDPNLPPSLRTVHRFIRKIFQNAQLSPECAIVTMVYLERLIHGGRLRLNVANWKRILLCAILLASKVWDDQAVWNIDYCQILDEPNVAEVNELERRFLEIIQFNINVPSSVYTKYYFDIRDLTVSTHEFTRLAVDTAKDLEACSSNLLDSNLGLATTLQHRLRRATSLDAYFTKPRSCPLVMP